MILVGKTVFFLSADVTIIGHVYGVSQYPYFYDQHLEKYQLLPRPHFGSFEGDNGEKRSKKNVCNTWLVKLKSLSVTVLK